MSKQTNKPKSGESTATTADLAGVKVKPVDPKRVLLNTDAFGAADNALMTMMGVKATAESLPGGGDKLASVVSEPTGTTSWKFPSSRATNIFALDPVFASGTSPVFDYAPEASDRADRVIVDLSTQTIFVDSLADHYITPSVFDVAGGGYVLYAAEKLRLPALRAKIKTALFDGSAANYFCELLGLTSTGVRSTNQREINIGQAIVTSDDLVTNSASSSAITDPHVRACLHMVIVPVLRRYNLVSWLEDYSTVDQVDAQPVAEEQITGFVTGTLYAAFLQSASEAIIQQVNAAVEPLLRKRIGVNVLRGIVASQMREAASRLYVTAEYAIAIPLLAYCVRSRLTAGKIVVNSVVSSTLRDHRVVVALANCLQFQIWALSDDMVSKYTTSAPTMEVTAATVAFDAIYSALSSGSRFALVPLATVAGRFDLVHNHNDVMIRDHAILLQRSDSSVRPQFFDVYQGSVSGGTATHILQPASDSLAVSVASVANCVVDMASELQRVACSTLSDLAAAGWTGNTGKVFVMGRSVNPLSVVAFAIHACGGSWRIHVGSDGFIQRDASSRATVNFRLPIRDTADIRSLRPAAGFQSSGTLDTGSIADVIMFAASVTATGSWPAPQQVFGPAILDALVYGVDDKLVALNPNKAIVHLTVNGTQITGFIKASSFSNAPDITNRRMVRVAHLEGVSAYASELYLFVQQQLDKAKISVAKAVAFGNSVVPSETDKVAFERHQATQVEVDTEWPRGYSSTEAITSQAYATALTTLEYIVMKGPRAWFESVRSVLGVSMRQKIASTAGLTVKDRTVLADQTAAALTQARTKKTHDLVAYWFGLGILNFDRRWLVALLESETVRTVLSVRAAMSTAAEKTS